MGNSTTQTIRFHDRGDLQVRQLCKVGNKGRDLDFVDGQLLPHLLLNASRKVKIVTVVGETGHGKSTIIELIASRFLDKLYRLFPSHSEAKEGTIGVQYFATSLDDGTELVLFDCEGFENDKEELGDEHSKQLYLLIAQIARLSTVTIHVSTDNRIKTSFTKFLKAVDIEEYHISKDPGYLKKKGILSNFIELLNKHDDLCATKSKEYPIFHKSYFFSKFSKVYASTPPEGDPISVQLDSDSIGKLSEICVDIRQLQFSSIHESTRSFKANQDCRSLYEVLIASMHVLKSRGLSEKKHFADIINLQLHQKNYVAEQIGKMFSSYCKTVGHEIKELFKSVPTDKYITIQVIQMILQAKQLKAKDVFAGRIAQIHSEWKHQFEKGLIAILRVGGGQNSLSDELLRQYTEIEGIKPSELSIHDTYDKNRGKYAGLGIYATGSAVVAGGLGASLTLGASEGATLALAGIRGLSLFGVVGLVASGVLTMALGVWLLAKSKNKQERISKWKFVLRKKLISHLGYLHLNCEQREDVNRNTCWLKDILKETISDHDKACAIIDAYTPNEVNAMVPLFYFNLISKSLKKKNIDWMSEDSQGAKQDNQTKQAKAALKLITSCAGRQPQVSGGQQVIKRIIAEILDTNFTKDEKEATKGKKIIEQFDVQSLKFKNAQHAARVERILQRHAISGEEMQDSRTFITCLMLLKLSMSDIFYSVLLSFFFPAELLDVDSFTTPDGIKRYFEFQDRLLDAQIRV